MSILDTFFILFESDASKLDKGLSDSEKKAKGLTQTVGKADAAANKLGGSLLHSLAGLAGAVTAAVSLHALTRSILEASNAADTLGKQTAAFGGSIEEVSAWGDAVKLAGGSAEGFRASIGQLSQGLAELEVRGTSRVAPFLKELGIDMASAANKGKSAFDLLPEIAEAFEKMSRTKSLGIGQKLGLDQGTIMLLQSGRRAVEEQIAKQKELGVVTAEQAKVGAEYNDAVDNTKHAFRSLWLELSLSVLPVFIKFQNMLTALGVFIRKHSDFVIGLMIALGAAIAFYVLPPLFSMAAAAIVAFAPFILAGVLVAALATAFALLYDDIMAFIDGGDSMIGAILNRWPIIGDVIKGIIGVFGDLWDIAAAVGRFFLTLWDNPKQAFADFLDLILNGLKALLSMIPGLSTVLGALGIDLSPSSTGAAVGAGKAALGQASGTALASQTSNSISNTTKGGKNTSVQVGKVEVHTQATDAEGISKAVGGTMQTQMRQAVNNFDDGVAA